MVVVGKQEAQDETVSVRSRKTGENEVMKVDEFINQIKEEGKLWN